MTKRKDERRELLKEDEFLSTLERIAQYIQQNPKPVFAWSAAVLVGLAIFFGILSYQESQKAQSSRALYRAEKILNTEIDDDSAELKFASEREKLEAALIELDQVIASQSGAAKNQAIIHKIRCMIDLGRRDGLDGLYKELAENGGDFQFFGMMGLADFYVSEKKYEDALAQYNRILNQRGLSFSDLVHYRKAICYQDMGKIEEAKTELNQIISAYNDLEIGEKPSIHAKAQQLLTELGDTAPATVEQNGG